MIVKKNFENLSVLHENTEPGRAYYIPSSSRMNNLVEERYKSDRLQLLNGNWSFKYYSSIYDVKEEFYELDFNYADYDKIPVPGVWQVYGYDKNQYTNIRYPFPFDPPYVPHDIPCGTYIHDFDYKKDSNAPKAFLNFEGIDSCFYVWLNGHYIGYSQVPHMTSEFDISKIIREGNNRIAVLVLKWCDGSYLEDQDKFRMSGIFRDVYILKRPENAIRDYKITTEIQSSSAQVKVNLDYYKPTSLTISLEDMEGNIISKQEIESSENKTELTFTVKNPILWNTEQPYLYTIIFESKKESIVDYVGLRKIEIKNNVVYFNNQNIKFRGVNRHDSDPVSGFTVDIEHIKRDLRLMKEHNFNSIRSSHYPNAPYFYQLCDKYGFMVIDEADIEAHGPFMIYYAQDTDYNRFKGWNKQIADNPDWEKSILDRVQLMVQRDKNRQCIVMWSMGNESAYGCNFEKALAWTKKEDPTRITQYESARYRNYDVTYDYSNLDLYSRMYPSFDEIEEWLAKDNSKPFLLVEYCHSMGNGPGDFEDYFQMIHEHDVMCGGFVWEWCDHAIYAGISENGKKKYLYGGDHGEKLHDGNFCMDGLVYPDRTPHTNIKEYKNVYRPARIVSFCNDKGELILHNYMDFINLEDYVNINYELSCDGKILTVGELKGFTISPHKNGRINLQLQIPQKGKVFLKLYYSLKTKTELLEDGYNLGFEEIQIINQHPENQMITELLRNTYSSLPNGKIKFIESDSEYVISGENFCYEYNKKTGLFNNLKFGNTEYINQPMEINLWRAPTDNDMYVKNEWRKAHFDEAYSRAYTSSLFIMDDYVEIKTEASVIADSVQKILSIKFNWFIYNNGSIKAKLNVTKNPDYKELPRFGIRLLLNRKFDQVSYYGYGPIESYCDKHRGSSHGLYKENILDMHEDYLRPQENGSHFDCDFVTLNSDTNKLTVVSEKTFSFNASVYTQEELENKKHNFELIPSNYSVLCIDYAQTGIGSNSCGPVTLEKYRFNDDCFSFEFNLIPSIIK